jgi:pyrimidine deaminase RibD-like protein
MKITDFIITKKPKLDKYLAKCCEMILEKRKEDPNYWGMVAACIIDPDNNTEFGVNHLLDDGTRAHAERVAIDNYTSKYGDKIPQGSIIITTLSPCSTDMDERHGESCTELINNTGVHKVYCGYKDPTQQDDENYKHRHFHVSETRNKKLKLLCQKLADTFLEKSKIVSELDKSKTYKKPIGMMEMYKFMQIATEEQKAELKKLINSGKQAEAWTLLQQVTNSKL